METLNLFNGNGHRYKTELPKLFYLTDYINEVALKHIEKNTGLKFIKGCWGYEVKPKSSKQIIKLLLTYDFKTQYHDNNTNRNTLFLKSCGIEGFKIRTICFNCCKDNNINLNGLSKKNKLLV